jgi:hypothetical protein
MAIRIICITKDYENAHDPHGAVQSLGWVNEQTRASGRSTLLEMVQFLERRGTAYLKDALGNVAYLVVRTSPSGKKYVKTIVDGKETDNLLALPKCAT